MDLDCISNLVISPEQAKHRIFNKKIFKIHKLDEFMQQRHMSVFHNLKFGSALHQSRSHLSSIGLDTEVYRIGQTFSLSEIIAKPESFLNDKIFEIVRGQDNIGK